MDWTWTDTELQRSRSRLTEAAPVARMASREQPTRCAAVATALTRAACVVVILAGLAAIAVLFSALSRRPPIIHDQTMELVAGAGRPGYFFVTALSGTGDQALTDTWLWDPESNSIGELIDSPLYASSQLCVPVTACPPKAGYFRSAFKADASNKYTVTFKLTAATANLNSGEIWFTEATYIDSPISQAAANLIVLAKQPGVSGFEVSCLPVEGSPTISLDIAAQEGLTEIVDIASVPEFDEGSDLQCFVKEPTATLPFAYTLDTTTGIPVVKSPTATGSYDCSAFNINTHDFSQTDPDCWDNPTALAQCPCPLGNTACGQNRCRSYMYQQYQDASSYCHWLRKSDARGCDAYCWAYDEFYCQGNLSGPSPAGRGHFYSEVRLPRDFA